MIPAKIDSSSIMINRKKGLESIVDWFDQHKQSFYPLGWFYLRNQQQMEELFYRSIVKVHKELPRFKGDTTFETWVTSLFILICRELTESLQAPEDSGSRRDLFQALDQLEEHQKEAIVLTYVKGVSWEDAAQLLNVSEEKLKDLLFSGVQSLRKEWGDGTPFNGCKKYQRVYIDYVERTLDRPRKIDLERHIYHCQDCQGDLATFQDVVLNLTERIEEFQVPPDFMENVKAKLAEKEKLRQRKNKKRKRIGIVFASVMALLISIEVFTKSFTNLYYTWTEENQELRAFLEQDLGERLNLEAESDGVKIKIKRAIADDVQTLVFYEIEDTKEDNQYMMNDDEGVKVENERKIMNHETYSRYESPDLTSEVNKKEKNVYHGKISLPSLSIDNGTVKLKITRLQKLIPHSSKRNAYRTFEEKEYAFGEWNFDIPVTKQPSIDYALKGETEVGGIPVRFDKLTVAPTATVLQYSIHNDQSEKQVEYLHFNNLVVNNKKVKSDLSGGSFLGSPQDGSWITSQSQFDPLFGEKPKEVNVQSGSLHLTVEDQKTIELDATQEYPQTFEYAGSIISIDKVEVGLPTNVVISNYETKHRAYESLQFQIVGEDENEASFFEMNSEGVIVDKNGMEYDMNNIPVPYEEIDQPRYFVTVQSIKFDGNNDGEKVIPKRLEIFGYSEMKYLDDAVNIQLE
ncbi:DUF4179 domain-containing protein [Neobacillus sp. MM2021_6]|uniref:DUF4179 domain-containing protein n=1 Tax=Bacillaceae TaxID=186817 RepID=UPI00140C68AC|nr:MULTISPECIES: DUF4179 domain-containing protein [Bacillaceae]MBO0959327.1 DUF4179 domain-containing protein [Neobacillus sp. MM2021_6]NHC19724.1 DUF4179 domain-containing protein [Bacillus sp. MM2020_4]